MSPRVDQIRHDGPPAPASLDHPAGAPTPRIGSGRGWAYTGVVLGIAASIAANVAHSYVPPAGSPPDFLPPIGAVVGAVFWPVALFVAIEIMARTPWPEQRRWTWLRFGGLTAVATVAAIVSYRHQAGLLAFYGEDPVTTVLGPLAVDGLMVMAAGALLATRRTRATSVAASDARSNETAPSVGASPTEQAVSEPAPDTGTDTPPAPRPRPTRRPAGRIDHRPAIARVHAQHPDWTRQQIAAAVGCSERTVRRCLPANKPTARLTAV